MNSSDKKDFADSFALTCLAYEKTFNTEQAKLYFADLAEFHVSDVVRAMTAHRKDSERGRFFPTIADLVHQIKKANKQTDSKHLAELEWSKVIQAASKGAQLKSGDQVSIASLQMIGGIKQVGFALPAELVSLKKAFLESYQSLTSCKADQVPDHLQNAQLLKQQKLMVVKCD